MQGWLVVNGFLNRAKFHEIYALLERASARRGIALRLVKTTELVFPVGEKPPVPLPDFVLFWDKDTRLARRLEDMRIPLFNAADGIENSDDKMRTALLLARAGLPQPKTVLAPKTFEGVGYADEGFMTAAAETLGFPMVVKEAFGSFGGQVYLAQNIEELKSLVKNMGYKPFLMQELVKSSYGRDIRLNVVGDRVACSMLRVNENDFRSNITNGGKAQAVTPPKEWEAVAIAATRALGLDFAGVDILFGENGEPIVCEVNSNPHFKSALDCTGVDVGEEIMAYIARSLQK